MIEAHLVKRFYVLAFIALVALSATACTRDKPETTPLATTIAPVGLPTSVTTTPTPVSAVVVTPTVTVAPTAVVVQPTTVPVPTATQPASTSAPGTYTVKWGDWLNKIATENGVTVQAILAANPGLNPNLIYPGQVINLPAPGAPPPSSSSAPPSGNPSTYTVQRGDWIYAIARKFGVSVAALLAANPGINPNFVFPGQQLNIPGAGTNPPPGGNPPGGTNTYVVQPGDTLFSIAVRFRTTTYDLQIKNNLANPNSIYPGQTLIIPQ